jgi:hypothetical protein
MCGMIAHEPYYNDSDLRDGRSEKVDATGWQRRELVGMIILLALLIFAGGTFSAPS